MGVRRDPQRNYRWMYEFQFQGERFIGYPKDEDGNWVRKKAEAEAAEAEAKKVAKAEAGMAKTGIKPGSYLLAQALDRHTENVRTDGGSESHLKSLARIGSEMLGHFGVQRAVIDIATTDVDGYRKFLVNQNRKVWLGGPRKITPADYANPKLWKELDRKRSASEVNHCLDLLRSALKAAHEIRDPRTGDRCLPFPPEVKPVADAERDPTPMPEEEFRARLEGAPLWMVHAALLMRFFGFRVAEALGIGPHHLDHEEQCLRLKAHETKSNKDQPLYGGHRGWILAKWLARRARRLGQDRLVLWPGHAWFKAQRRGERVPDDAWRPLKTIRRAWRDTVERAGIETPHRVHDVRAAYITNIARLGSSSITKGLARHASIATTERYIKIVQPDLADAAQRADTRAREQRPPARPKLRVVK